MTYTYFKLEFMQICKRRDNCPMIHQLRRYDGRAVDMMRVLKRKAI